MASKADRKRAKLAMRAKGGRPRRSGAKRYASGEIVKAEQAKADFDVMATARAQPHRKRVADLIFAKHLRGLDVERLFGSPLGRMLAEAIISRRQYDAGVRFAEELSRSRAIIGLPPATTQAIEYGRVNGGGRMEMATDEALKAGERLLTLRRVLAEVDWPGDPVRPAIIVRQIVLEDRDESTLGEPEVGALRVALNALAHLYKIDIDGGCAIAA